MDQNAYVYLSGMMFTDDNYSTITKKAILDHVQYVKNRISRSQIDLQGRFSTKDYQTITLDRTLAKKTYSYPCTDLANVHCLNDILNKPELNTLLENNKKLLERYLSSTQKSFYKSYIFDYGDPFLVDINWPNIVFLSSLTQIKAIQLIENKQINAGLTLFQKEITFYKNILAGNGNLPDQIFATRLLLTNYHTLGQLLDLPTMQSELKNPLLTTLFAPLTKQEQQAIGRALIMEREYVISNLEAEDQQLAPIPCNKYTPLLKKANLPLSYNKNKTLNTYYQLLQPYIDEAFITLPKASTHYLADYNQKSKPKEISLDRIIQNYGTDNILGGIEILDDLPDYKKFSYQFYNASNYLALITAKLEIKQAHITKQQVPDFLNSLGEKGVNPYTQKPFVWDEQQQTLSSDWLDLLPRPPQYGKQASVYIAFP